MIILVLIITFLLGRVFVRLPRGSLACGLFGYSGSKYPDYSVLKLLAIDAEYRGSHSTGLYGRGKGIWKTVDEASKAVYNSKFKDHITSKLVIGHTRYATTGARTAENAHPFQFPFKTDKHEGTIIGAHNGWLIHPEWQAMKNGMPMPEVDSQLIFHHLIKNNMDFSSLRELHGAMALSFSIGDRLYLYRRSSKPLYMAQVGITGLYYSSREEGLEMAGLKNIMEVPEDEILGFEYGILVDNKYYGGPDIELPCDVSPMMWRSKGEGTKIIPFEYEIERELREYKNKNNRSVERRQIPQTVDSILSKPEKDFPIEDAIFVSNKRNDIKKFLDDFRSEKNDHQEIEITSGDIDQAAKSDSKTSFILVNLVSTKSKEDVLKGWHVFVDSDPYQTVAKTSSGGIAVIEIMLKEEESIRLICLPPGEKNSYYSKIIKVSPSSVLEVTLSLEVFPTGEKGEEFKKEVRNFGFVQNRKEEDDPKTDSSNSGDETESSTSGGLGRSGKHTIASEHIREIIVLPKMYYDFKDYDLQLNCNTFENPYVASEIALDVISVSTSTPLDQLNTITSVLEELEIGGYHIGKCMTELNQELRDSLCGKIILIMNSIYSYDGFNPVVSKIDRNEFNDIEWYKAYEILRETILKMIDNDEALAIDIANRHGANISTEENNKEEKDNIKIITTNGDLLKVDSKMFNPLFDQTNRLTENYLSDFWQIPNPYGISKPEELYSCCDDYFSALNTITKSLIIIKVKLLAGYKKGYNLLETSNKIDSFLVTLEESMTKFSILKSLPPSEVTEQSNEEVFSAWSEAERASSDLCGYLIDLNSTIYKMLPKSEKVPF